MVARGPHRVVSPMTDQPDIVMRLRDFENEGLTSSDRFHLRNDAAKAIESLRIQKLPICAVTGHIAGDIEACGDCDPCGAAASVPEVVKQLLADRDEWATKYGEAMAQREGLTPDQQAMFDGALDLSVSLATRETAASRNLAKIIGGLCGVIGTLCPAALADKVEQSDPS